MVNEIYPSPHYDLIRLRKYLNYEISSGVLYIVSFTSGMFLYLAAIAAIIFIPFMIKTLYRENKNNWIIAFIVIGILPLLIFIVLGIFVEFSRPLILISLGLLYFYFFLLRIKVNGWIRDINMLNRSRIQKNKIDEELEIFTHQFDRTNL